MIGIAAVLLVAGMLIGAGATRARRRLWRRAEPFTGDERGAPEPVLVHPAIVHLVYLGWVLVASGMVVAMLELFQGR